MSYTPEKALWQEVLMRQINDALNIPVGIEKHYRKEVIEEARRYLTVPNRDFDEVCSLAGMDPDAVRERLTKRIADAPTPDEMLAAPSKYANKNTATPPVTRKRRGKTIVILRNGRERTLTQLSEDHGVNRETLRKRIAAGWSINLALSAAPIRGRTRPGVVSDFGASQGTGVGTAAQDSPNLTFSDRKAS